MWWMFERPTFETHLGDVAIWRRGEHLDSAGRNAVPVTGIDLRGWITDDRPGVRQAILRVYDDFAGAAAGYGGAPRDRTLAHVATVLERAFDQGDLVAVLVGPVERDAGELVVRGGAVEPQPVPPRPPRPPNKSVVLTPRTWVGIQMIDEAGKPVGAIAFELKLSDGSIKKGRLDEQGSAHFEGIDPGQCEISFPEIDAREWGPV